MSSQNFSEEAFFSAYKQIRNLFRRYLPHTVAASALNYLRTPTSKSVDELQKHPWLVFLLLKWVLLDEQYYHRDKRRITSGEFLILLGKMHGLGSRSITRMPSEYAHYRLWFRNISYQQFLYQADFNSSAFARQSLLFDKLPANHTFRLEFQKATSIPLADFFELSSMLLAHVLNDNNSPIAISWFSPVMHRYDASTIQRFLDLLSFDLDSLRQYLLQENDSKKRRASEFYEETLFLKFPLLRSNGTYHLWHPMLFNRGLEYFVYDTLRSPNPSGFMSKFGDIFEEYVHRSIEYLGLPYLREKQIQKMLIGSGKVTDFFITEDGANVFIDAKGVEMAYLGKVSHAPEVILGKVATSAIKGIEQGFQVVKRLSAQGLLNQTFRASSENYLLIVTFKELYLGNGQDFYDMAAKNKIDSFVGSGSSPPIPLENIYFLTVDDLDHFAHCVNKGEVCFIDFIRKAVRDDRSGPTKKFHFRQHLSEIGMPPGTPQYLDDEVESIFGRIEHLLSIPSSSTE
ncbi:MAG: hypothetical protein Q8J80_11770 [Gallionella sp.]|nr:hypothetical protein [Gallionella sp.]